MKPAKVELQRFAEGLREFSVEVASTYLTVWAALCDHSDGKIHGRSYDGDGRGSSEPHDVLSYDKDDNVIWTKDTVRIAGEQLHKEMVKHSASSQRVLNLFQIVQGRQPAKPARKVCTNTNCTEILVAGSNGHGRCNGCREYWRRTGKERPLPKTPHDTG